MRLHEHLGKRRLPALCLISLPSPGSLGKACRGMLSPQTGTCFTDGETEAREAHGSRFPELDPPVGLLHAGTSPSPPARLEHQAEGANVMRGRVRAVCRGEGALVTATALPQSHTF